MTTRRDFLAGMAAAAAVPSWREPPELILVNGSLLTQDPATPRAQAIAIAGGRILAVGSTAEIRALARAGTRTADLGGKVVIPGVIDAHNHPAYAGIRQGWDPSSASSPCGRRGRRCDDSPRLRQEDFMLAIRSLP